jgi:hypothetical protein
VAGVLVNPYHRRRSQGIHAVLAASDRRTTAEACPAPPFIQSQHSTGMRSFAQVRYDASEGKSTTPVRSPTITEGRVIPHCKGAANRISYWETSVLGKHQPKPCTQ